MIHSIFFQPLLVEWLLRSVAISILAMAGLRFLARSSSAARCRFLLTVMGILLVLPLVMPFVRWQVVMPSLSEATGSGAGTALLHALPAVMGVWLVGCLTWIAVLFTGMWHLNRQVTEGSRLDGDPYWCALLDGCCQRVGCRVKPRLITTSSRSMPCAVGLFRPTVILPESAADWDESRRRLVLLHELGHLVRGDLWLQWASLIVRAVYWFNPAVWFLHQSLLSHREEACDALVLATGARPKEYARHLLDIASTHRPASSMSPALAMSGRGLSSGKLERRIVRLLSSEKNHHPGRLARWLGGFVSTAFAVLVLGAAFVAPVFTSGQEAVSPWTDEEINLRFTADPFPAE